MLPRLWSSQLDLAEELEMGLSLSQASLASSDALRPESMLLACSSSEEIGISTGLPLFRTGILLEGFRLALKALSVYIMASRQGIHDDGPGRWQVQTSRESKV